MYTKNKKIAIVIQRYGKQVNGGAEVHAKMIAEQLAKFYAVTVLTSCAIDYKTWLPVMPEGLATEGDVTILRFGNGIRNPKKLRFFQKKITNKLLIQKLFKKFNYPKWMLSLFSSLKNDEQNDHLEWLTAQGPSTPLLIEYLNENKNNYEAFIFFTTIYYPTALGILQVAPKSILIPTLHDEAVSYFPGYKNTMAAAKWIFFNTKAEQLFAEKLFSNLTVHKQIVAVGVDLPDEKNTKPLVPKQHGIYQPYLVYIGRVDYGKGCDTLIEYFIKCIEENMLTLKLILVGKINMPTVKHKQIEYTGYVTDETKINLLQGALALAIPSEFESLSLVLLESFAYKIPVLANGKSEVLKNHILKSNGGWCFENYTEFNTILLGLLKIENENLIKAKNGFNYVAQNYSWQNVLDKFKIAIDAIEQGK